MMFSIQLVKAFFQGVEDGIAEPEELSSGMTWGSEVPHNNILNEAYDAGVNIGQMIGKLENRPQ